MENPAAVALGAMGLLMLAVGVIGIFLAHRKLFCIRYTPLAATQRRRNLMGISTRSTTIRIYMLSTGLATLAGIVFDLYPCRICAGGRRCELDAIALSGTGGTL